MKTEPGVTVLQCSYCDKDFKYESEKRRHEQSHVPQFECKVCSKKFSFMSALRRHEKQHERTRSVHCSKCGGMFRDETLLKRHMQYAHKGTHKCEKCGATLNSDLALKTHMKTHKPESERTFRCCYEGCGKTFNFAHHLKHHELTHTDDKPHLCKECGKRFIQLHHFKVHQRVHQPDSWLTCPELNCTKEFTNEYALRRHIARHNNKSTFKTSKDSAADIKISKKSKETKPSKTISTQDDTRYITKDIEKLSVSKQSDIDTKKEKDVANESTMKVENYAETVDSEVLNVDQQFEDTDVVAADNFENFDHNVEEVFERDEIDDVGLSTSNCTSAIGKCIVTGNSETSDSCLCGQMSSEKDYDKLTLAIDNKNKNNVKLMDDLKCIEKRLNNVNACETCECASICGIRDRATEKSDKNETPKLEIRNDGIIKIQDTFDIDFENIQGCNNVQTFKEDFDFKDKVHLLNSCKDILGNCIVSGDGTIGEGCLCAKMSANDQQIIDQEIEEITPCPKGNWYQ